MIQKALNRRTKYFDAQRWDPSICSGSWKSCRQTGKKSASSPNADFHVPRMHTQVGKVFAAGNEDECVISALGRKKDNTVHMCVRPVGGINQFPIVQLKA
ncbi:hypothetical protein HDU76_011541, partial [Blyttiomyces sp. JEL0837]